MNNLNIETNDFDPTLDDPRQAMHSRTSTPIATPDTAPIAIPNQRKIVTGITKAFGRMESAKKGYVNSVIKLGDELNSAKLLVPHGAWERFLKVNSELTFGHEQATKFMKIANNKVLVLEYFSNENSVNNLARAISDATPEQLARVADLKLLADEIKQVPVVKSVAPLVPDEVVITPSIGKEALEDIVYAEFEEVALPEVKQEPSSHQDLDGYSDDDFAADVTMGVTADLVARNEYLEGLFVVFEDADHTAAAVKKIGELHTVISGLESQINTYLNENAAMKGQINRLEARCKRLEKANVK
jgi:hypothetical protein